MAALGLCLLLLIQPYGASGTPLNATDKLRNSPLASLSLFYDLESRMGDREVLKVSVPIGVPFNLVDFEVRFDHTGVFIPSYLWEHSTTFSSTPPSDTLELGNQAVAIRFDQMPVPRPETEWDRPIIRCRGCKGVLGLHAQSDVRRRFPAMTVSRASIRLGVRETVTHPLGGVPVVHGGVCDPDDVWTMSCSDFLHSDRTLPSMCRTQAVVYGKRFTFDVDMGADNFVFPDEVWDSFFSNGAHSMSKVWDDELVITFPGGVQPIPCSKSSVGIEDNVLNLKLKHSDLVYYHEMRVPKLRMSKASDVGLPADHGVLPSRIIKYWMIHHDTATPEYLIIREVETYDDIPVGNAIMVFILFCYLVIFKFTHTLDPYMAFRTDKSIALTAGAVMRMMAYAISGASLVLLPTLRIILDYPWIYALSIALFLYCLLAGEICGVYMRSSRRGDDLIVRGGVNVTLSVFVFRLCHETSVIIGMFMLVLPARSEGVVSPYSFAVMTLGVYSSVLYSLFISQSIYSWIDGRTAYHGEMHARMMRGYNRQDWNPVPAGITPAYEESQNHTGKHMDKRMFGGGGGWIGNVSTPYIAIASGITAASILVYFFIMTVFYIGLPFADQVSGAYASISNVFVFVSLMEVCFVALILFYMYIRRGVIIVVTRTKDQAMHRVDLGGTAPDTTTIYDNDDAKESVASHGVPATLWRGMADT